MLARVGPSLATLAALAVFAPTGFSQAHAQGAPPVNCAGGDAAVRGDGQLIDIRGVCRSLTVEGSGNTVRATLAPGAFVSVRGDDNHVRWRIVGGTIGARPVVTGNNNVVGPESRPLAGVAAPPTQPPLLLPAASSGSFDCRDRDVTLSGDGGNYTLHGGCRSLTVRGSGNTLQAEMQPRSRIDVEGEGDVVNWFLSAPGPRPFAEVSGQGSVVREQQRLGTVIAPPSPVPSTDLADPNGMPPLLVVPGEGPQERDCAGRDAVVQGDDATFVLRGACRTLTVQGSNDRVMAELAGGSRIKIVGSNTHVQFALLGPGPDPIVSVNGEGSNAWRVQRLGSEAGGGVGPTPEGMRVRGGPGAAVKEMPAVPQPVGPDVGPP